MNAAPDLIPSVMNMLAALAAVLGALIVMVHLARRYLQRPGALARERLIRILASEAMGAKKAVTLVGVPGSVLVLGVTAESIQLLSRIDDPELLDRIRAHAPASAPSFIEHLSRLTGMKVGARHD